MKKITLDKEQAKKIAQGILEDIRAYRDANFERFFLWYFNGVRNAKGKPPVRDPALCDRCPHRDRPHCDVCESAAR